MRGGGYNYAFSYYQTSTNTCICSQHPPLATDYVAECTDTNYEVGPSISGSRPLEKRRGELQLTCILDLLAHN